MSSAVTEQQWLERRRQNIGSSEVASLFSAELAAAGEHTYRTRYETWHIKAGLIEESSPSQGEGAEDDDPVFWGTVLEPAIAEGFARLRGLKIRRLGEGRYRQHAKVRGMASTGDYEIVGVRGRGPGLLEVKNVSWQSYRREWAVGEDGAVRPPLRYLLQVEHQLACFNRSWGVLVPLVGGSKLAPVEVERHEGTIAKIEGEVSRFWDSIDRREPPPPDWEADADTVAQLFRAVDAGKVLRIDELEVAQLCEQYLAAGDLEKVGKAQKGAAKAQLLSRIGDASQALVGGGAFKVWAKEVAGGTLIPERVTEAYRGFRIYDQRKPS